MKCKQTDTYRHCQAPLLVEVSGIISSRHMTIDFAALIYA